MANIDTYKTLLEGNQDSRVADISQDVPVLTQFNPFVYNLAFANARPAIDIKYQWDEIDLNGDYTLINNSGGYNTSATSIIVDDGSLFTKYDMVRNLRTGEVFQVSAVSSNTLTVIRGVGNSGTGISMNDNDPLLIIGSALEEASQSRESSMANSSTVYNYLQTYRESFSFAGSTARMNGSPTDRKLEDMAFHMDVFVRDLEYSLIFQKRDLDQTSFTRERYSTGGLLDYISTNTEAIGGTTITEKDWLDFLVEKAFAYGSTEKVFICGYNFFTAFSYWGTNNYQVGQTIDVGVRQGVNVAQYIAPTGGVLWVYNHELFRKDSNLAGMGIVIDPMEIRLRYADRSMGDTPEDLKYKNGLPQFGMGLQENDRDGVKHEYFAQVGLELRQEKRHALITGVTGPTTS